MAYVRDDNNNIVGRYGAEAFRVIFFDPANSNNTIFHDGVNYEAAPTQFSVQVQDLAVSDEFVVLASVSGDLGTGPRNAAQSGVGALYRADEFPASFQPQIGSGRFSVTALDKSKIRVVPGTYDAFLKDSYGYLKFNVTNPAVGLILSKQGVAGQAAGRWSGIRTLHKTNFQTVFAGTLRMPMFSPFCGF